MVINTITRFLCAVYILADRVAKFSRQRTLFSITSKRSLNSNDHILSKVEVLNSQGVCLILILNLMNKMYVDRPVLAGKRHRDCEFQFIIYRNSGKEFTGINSFIDRAIPGCFWIKPLLSNVLTI